MVVYQQAEGRALGPAGPRCALELRDVAAGTRTRALPGGEGSRESSLCGESGGRAPASPYR